MGRDKVPAGGKAAIAKAAADKKAVEDAKAKGVESMECRHILVEKHSKAVEIIEIITSGERPGNPARDRQNCDFRVFSISAHAAATQEGTTPATRRALPHALPFIPPKPSLGLAECPQGRRFCMPGASLENGVGLSEVWDLCWE